MGWYCQHCGHQAEVAGNCPRDASVLAPIAQHDLLGRQLGDYIVLAGLGGGSFGTVYRAVQPRSGGIFAIKLLHRSITDTESQRVITEARAAAMLAHPNVVAVYDLGLTSDRRPYIVMQHLDGQPLAKLLAPAPIEQVTAIAKDVLRGLDAAHRRGVVHRDLKPDNIFFTPGGRSIIVDFGLAKLVADPRAAHLTVTGEAIGTPHYMAPEQIRGKEVDGRADLYALACVLYQLLAGQPPFDATSTFQLFDAHLHYQATPIAQLRPDTPAPLAAAIMRALAKDPAARFADARAMHRALGGRRGRPRWPLVLAGTATCAAFTVLVGFAMIDRERPVAAASPAPAAASPTAPKPTPAPIASPPPAPPSPSPSPSPSPEPSPSPSPEPSPSTAAPIPAPPPTPVATAPRVPHRGVPPSLPGEPPLPAPLETALATLADNMPLYSSANLQTLLCAFDQGMHAAEQVRVAANAQYRAYMRRAVAMFEARLGVDAATACAKHR